MPLAKVIALNATNFSSALDQNRLNFKQKSFGKFMQNFFQKLSL
jgi:hypothetical protein